MVLGTALLTISIIMTDIKTMTRNFIINVSDTIYNTGIHTGVSTVIEFSKFKLYYWMTCIFEYYFIKEYKDYYEVNYFFIGSPYKIIIEKQRGSKPISKIIDITTDKNITSTLRKELGPFKNFHNLKITPRILGYPDGLEVYYKTNESILYKQDEVIFCI